MAKEKQAKNESEKAETVSFLHWFVQAIDSKPQLKAHHMNAVKSYFDNLGLSADEPQEKYEAALKQYGI